MDKLGRGVNPDYLRKLLFEGGVHRADVRQPTNMDIEPGQVAHVDTITANLIPLEVTI